LLGSLFRGTETYEHEMLQRTVFLISSTSDMSRLELYYERISSLFQARNSYSILGMSLFFSASQGKIYLTVP